MWLTVEGMQVLQMYCRNSTAWMYKCNLLPKISVTLKV